MPGVNRTIIAAVIIITAGGIFHVLFQQKSGGSVTKVLIGGYMLALVASVFELVGFGIDKISGWILALAAGVTLFMVISGGLGSFGQTPGSTAGNNAATNIPYNASGLPTIPAIANQATNQNFSGTPQQVSAATQGANTVAAAQAGATPGSALSKLPQKVCVRPSSPFDLGGWVTYGACKLAGGSG